MTKFVNVSLSLSKKGLILDIQHSSALDRVPKSQIYRATKMIRARRHLTKVHFWVSSVQLIWFAVADFALGFEAAKRHLHSQLRNVKTSMIVLHIFAKKFTARWKMALASLSLKLALGERKCDKQSVAL